MSAAQQSIDPQWLDNGPAFSEPWQAEAFALTLQLARAGHFTWTDWVGTFSAEITASPQTADEDINTAYYRQWMQALEKILAARALVSSTEVTDYEEDWRRSYFHTAHGAPIEFRKGLEPIPSGALEELDHDHCDDHHHSHGPVAISPARKLGTVEAEI